jgi:DNA-3-methyladenine glycosylase I
MDVTRCSWAEGGELLRRYHDHEYGVLVREDDVIFERLMLEIYQAGLSWHLILKRRQGFRKAFYQFELHKVAAMTDGELDSLMNNPEIIKNRMKIRATRHNAAVCLKLIEQWGSLYNYFRDLPYQAAESALLVPCVKRMKSDGFSFIGPTILEEFFMSIGFNEVPHDPGCFLFRNKKNGD